MGDAASEEGKAMMKNVWQKFWPLFVILGIWFVFSSPYFLRGKVPFSSTYQVTFFAPWSMYSQFGQPVKNAAMPDVISQIYPWRHLGIQLWKDGQIPLWNRNSFGGTPLLANYQSAVLSPLNILFFLFPFIDAWSLLVLFQPLLAGLGMYVFARQSGVSKSGSLLSSISFMFCGFIVVWMGYGTLGYALAFLPYALTGLAGFFSTKKMRYLFLLSLSLPLSFFSGHFQISLYVLVTVGVYWLFVSVRSRSFRLFLLSGIYLVSGVLLCLPQILPSLEFYTQSLRSGLFQKGEVIPLGYLPTFLAPDFLGNPVTRNDWFGHYAEWNTYIGVIPLFLALFALSAWKKPLVRFAWIVGIVCLLLAFDTPVADVFVALHIPVLSTSAMGRIVSIYSFFFALLAGFGLDSLYAFVVRNKKRAVGILISLVVICFSLLWGMVLGKLFLPLDKIGIAKQNLIFPTIIALSVVITLLIGMSPNKRLKKLFLVLLIMITTFDMYRFVTKWQSFDPKSLVTPSVPVLGGFEKIKGYERSFGNYGAQVSDYYNLPSLEGYDALYPRRFGEFASYVADGRIHEAERSVVSFPRDGKYTASALNLLNVKYIIHKVADTKRGWTFPYWKYPDAQFSLLFNDGVYQILQNNFVYPHAFLVGDYKVQSSAEKKLKTLFTEIDQRKSIVLEENPRLNITDDQHATSEIKQYTADSITVQTTATTNMILFLSDNYYPGWKAFVDGKETKIYRADYTFRAVEVPAGKHIVIFSYLPSSFLLGMGGALVGLVLLLVGWTLSKNLFSPKLESARL